ncbi:unnamed protein product [Paramecium primaurelia]|uniref:RNA helicase n=1 Tax=Paramecium primaurelia TaxID=5886 RepID=A0A8S1M4B8_PARPR|nr:unnamed protein product [Paramecium primaurelia]
MLSVFQVLKNGICTQKKKKVVVEQKVEAKESESESEEQPKVVEHDLKRARRKESLDQIEHEMTKRRTQEIQYRNTLLKKLKIKISGDNINTPILTNFSKMKNYLNSDLMNQLTKCGYQKPTPIQMVAIPIILQKKNLIAIAPTGSGKTCAFALPTLHNLESHKEGGPRCLVFAPAQELADQLYKEFNKFNKELKIKQIQEMNREKQAFKQAWNHIDILISSPLKFLKLHKVIDLSTVEYVIMDEADKYFELGLLAQVKQLLRILESLQITYMFFSATLPEPVEDIYRDLLIDPIKIMIGGRNHVLSRIDQQLRYVSNEYGKIQEIRNLINEGQMTPPVLVFVQSKTRAEALMYEIQQLKVIRVNCIHGDMESKTRQEIVEQFHKGTIWMLICTDMMARGIDFKDVQLVINYDFPQSMITYVHRVGRTGRAGKQGKAITLFTDEDKSMLRSLANVLKVSGCQVPEWLFELPNAKKQLKKKRERFPVKRENIEDQ